MRATKLRFCRLLFRFLAGLLHDIGKGFGKGHAERGAELARQIGKRFGLDDDAADSLEFLVSNHMFLSRTAQRRDLEDEDLIMRCARKVDSPEKLAMLYLLTIADARATGPTVWNDWKAALVLELYLKIALLLDNKDFSEQEQVRSAETGVQWIREKVIDILPEVNKDISELFSDDYLLGFAPEDIVQHITYAKELEKQDVLFFHKQSEESWTILAMTKDRPGLLARIFGVLALHNLNVLAAKILTGAVGTGLDAIEVSSAISESYDGQDWETMEKELLLAIQQRMALDHRLNGRHPTTVVTHSTHQDVLFQFRRKGQQHTAVFSPVP